ncbi:PAS-domain containing protein [Thalassococcus sp. S3]|uniref:PAS-domain containing protein n=1 Tax=Thalassococcus sp. S3 TaxID=2017482 RepID=UPI00102477EC|nr:PAS-domain containing protein [Thalassococcus sp. S3]QBF29618.1 diguanylate cyclase [Thalassococcus sp. S3]
MIVSELIIISLASAVTAALAVLWLIASQTRDTRNWPDIAREPVFLFDGAELLEANVAAQKMLPDREEPLEWSELAAMLSRRFAAFPSDQQHVQASSPLILEAKDRQDRSEAHLEWLDGIYRVHIRNQHAKLKGNTSDLTALTQMRHELTTLRTATQGTPYPAWQIDDEGKVSWYNPAYAKLYKTVFDSTPDPDKRLFQTSLEDRPTGSKVRASITVPGREKFYWYDVSITRTDHHRTFYAVDVDAVVNAEIAQRNFVQTLAKTFAQLSIGLAIFDRNRQLALFNPALIDLTALPADFLSARPNLLSFFDRLRDARMMPEPKNYGSWRDQIAELVAAASDGRYSETWTLPSGSTYRVTGRPHPDGAIAFLIEDITAEITLTRRFRSELELSQSILDRLDDAIVVFSSTGVVTLTNQAYRDMWGVDPDSSFADISIVDATRHWQSACAPTPVLGDLRDYILGCENRSDWTASMELKSGDAILCQVHPVQSGATMVVFKRPIGSVLPELERITLEHSAT